MTATLFYVHDPMCSWCWGFSKVWQQIRDQLPNNVNVQLVAGGLAPDSMQAMPESMQLSLQQTWQHIQQVIPGTEFNHQFWSLNAPRRSTYPACRAVLAAKAQHLDLEIPMMKAIQKAYYLDAKNPSDDAILIELATDIGCNVDQFSQALNSEDTHQILMSQIHFARLLGVHGFPSLVVETESGQRLPVDFDYIDACVALDNLAYHLDS